MICQCGNEMEFTWETHTTIDIDAKEQRAAGMLYDCEECGEQVVRLTDYFEM